jgi:hypothetical protein
VSKDLAKIIALKFIQRRDVKAVQFKNGSWSPDSEVKSGNHGLGWKLSDIEKHLNKEAVYGHYLLDAEDRARVFVFDIDLVAFDKNRPECNNYVSMPGLVGQPAGLTNEEFDAQTVVYEDVNPRELWHDRSQLQARAWYKLKMMELAHKFTSACVELGVPTAAAYSGSKGIHVYGFTGNMPASEVREGALLALDIVGEFEPSKGKNFYRHTNLDPITGYPTFELEVFPKQPTLEGKSLGNLVRLPLGMNHKSPKDPTFFLDLKAPMGQFRPHPRPIELLESGNPYI